MVVKFIRAPLKTLLHFDESLSWQFQQQKLVDIVDLPLDIPCPVPHPQPGVLALSCCERSPVSRAAGLHLSPLSPGGGPGPRTAIVLLQHPRLHQFSLVSVPIWLIIISAALQPAWLWERLGPLLSFPIFPWAWERTGFLSNYPVFPDSSQVCILILSCIFSPDFSRFVSCHLWSPFWLPLCIHLVKGETVKFPLNCFSFPPLIQGNFPELL